MTTRCYTDALAQIYKPRAEDKPLSMPETNKSSRSAATLYWLNVSGFFLVSFSVFLTQLDWSSYQVYDNKIALFLALFDWYIFELLAVLLIGGICIHGNRWVRSIAYIIAASFAFINLVQVASYYQTGRFITQLALENINHVSHVLNTANTMALVTFLVAAMLCTYFVEKRRSAGAGLSKPASIFVAFLFLGCSTILLANPASWWTNSLTLERNKFLKRQQQEHLAPVASLYKTIISDLGFVRPQGLSKSGELADMNLNTKSDSLIKRTQAQTGVDFLDTAIRYGFNFKLGARFPLVKNWIYRSEPPFLSEPTEALPKSRPNVIVFFIEGFSARTSNVYGSDYTQITPNLVAFAEQSMVVDNYYNHTAATYRGLHGQNCSIYPKYGGTGGWHTNYKDLPKTNYFCIADALNGIYHTRFLYSQLRDNTYLDEMMETLSYDEILSGDDLLLNYLPGQTMGAGDAVSDQQFFSALIEVLREEEITAKNSPSGNSPFFMALYNFETHAFKDVKQDGKRFGAGDNSSLNTIHNLDDSFGKFWKYFQKSSLAKNTIIIFTADHSHYHEKPYVEAVDKPGAGYQKIFVDKIPLIIHDPTRSLPNRYDAKYATSIDFAPSLLHYLGTPNQINSFMGESIFEEARRELSVRMQGIGISSFGQETFFVDSEKIHGGRFRDGKYKEEMDHLHRFFRIIQRLESENRIWDDSLGGMVGHE